MARIFFLLTLSLGVTLLTQAQSDSLPKGMAKRRPAAQDKIYSLLYVRVISDASRNYRVDENFVVNARLNRWLRLEAGFRLGERPEHLDSYYHYKLELQSKQFWNTVRFIARLSDNVIKFPSPTYSRSNYLLLAEARRPLSERFSVLVAGGYVFSTQRNGTLDGAPSWLGAETNYPIFKLALRYAWNERNHAQFVWGSYDVFNPYLLQSPFLQVDYEHEFSGFVGLYSYYRYQYDHSLGVPFNYFLGFGVRLHLVKG